jgi:hypothetical protein
MFWWNGEPHSIHSSQVYGSSETFHPLVLPKWKSFFGTTLTVVNTDELKQE